MASGGTEGAPAGTLTLLVNGKAKTLEGPASVQDLLASLGLPLIGVAVERNKEIVPKPRYADTWLADGDRLEIVTLVGGG